MHWSIKVLFVVILCGVILWNVWARVLAAIVSALSTRQGVKVKVESLTMRTATQILVTFSAKGFIEEIRCRRIQIGWVSSVCQSVGRDEEEEEESPVSIIHRLFMLISMCRLHVRAVGVQVRLRECKMQEGKEGVDQGSKVISGSGKAGMLVKTILPLISFELNDVEVYNVGAEGHGVDSIFRGKKISLDLKRKDQDLLLENVYVCPGKRFVKNDTICNECGLVEINRMAIASKNSLHELLTSFNRNGHRHRKGSNLKKLSVDVSSIRLNLDTRYLKQIKSCTSVLNKGSLKDRETTPMLTKVHKALGDSSLPTISFNLALRALTIHLPLSNIQNEIDVKGLHFDLHTHPCSIDSEKAGRLEASVEWDKITGITGESVDVPTWECQSSRSESQATLCISCNASESTKEDSSPPIMDIAFDVHVSALHTKLHHERIGRYLSALGSSVRVGGSAKKSKPTSLTPVHAKLRFSLGNGSSLQFVNGDNVCMLHHSVDSASVTLTHSSDTTMTRGSALKFSFCGIAMADSTSTVESEIHDLCEVLSNDSFSGSITLDENRNASVDVSISSLAGKISDTLMRHICSIVSSILENATSLTGMPKTGDRASIDTGVQKPSMSFRVDLLKIDVAILSTYTVKKVYSSINKDQTIDTAVALKLESLTISRASSGLHSANGHHIMILYYEGKGVGDFNINFDLMDDSIHAKPLIMDRITLEEVMVGDLMDRQISVGTVEIYGHVDALLSIIHFSKSMEELIGVSCEKKTSQKRDPYPRNTRTGLKISDASVCLPVSSDREVSMALKSCEFLHSKNEIGDICFTASLLNTSMTIKGMESIRMKRFVA